MEPGDSIRGMSTQVLTRTKVEDPLGIVAALVAGLGAAISAVLWASLVRPASPILRDITHELTRGGPLRDQAILLAAALGAVGVFAALLSLIGARPRALAALCAVFGAIALSYPALAFAGVIDAPAAFGMFIGS